jgi:methyl-accepting chemotaxis protein
MRQLVSWWLRGQAQTRAALDDHAAAIRDLQHKVAELTDVSARTLTEQTRAAIDDLTDRVGALADVREMNERLAELERAVAELARLVAPPDSV